MASLFRSTYSRPAPADAHRVTLNGKPAVRFKGPDGKPLTAPLTKDGAKCLVKSPTWSGKYRDASGVVRVVALSKNKEAAGAMLREIVTRVEHEKAGLVDPNERHVKTPLADHLPDWLASLTAANRDPKHVDDREMRARRVLDECGFVFAKDLSAQPLERFLTKLKTDEEASIRTANAYLQAIRQMIGWMVADGRMPRDPLAGVAGGNVALDVRYQRRSLSDEEMAALVTTAAESAAEYRGLTGRDRAAAYMTAMGTGFRVAELAALTPRHFVFTPGLFTVTLPAETTKNRKAVTQPIAAGLADGLRDYLAGRNVDEPVWPGTWSEKAAKMLRIDLEAADIPYAVDSPTGPLVCDFHALRFSYVASLDRAGVPLRLAVQLARHSDPKLTINRYGRAQVMELADAVKGLKTGQSLAPPLVPACTKLVPESDGSNGKMMVNDGDGLKQVKLKVLDLEGVEGLRGDVMGEEEDAFARVRTVDPLIKSQLLYQLSYEGFLDTCI